MKLPMPVLLRGDARALPLPDASVDLICTSPPYFGLRSYTDGGEHYAGQVGSEATPAEFLAALVECTREMVRVLKPSGSIFVNLGDKYDSGTTTARTNPGTVKDGTGQGWYLHSPRVSLGRPKSLLLIPERYRIACTDQLGLIARAVLVWSKPNGLPESVTDRVRRSHEDWVHLTLLPRYFSAVDEIREQSTPQGGAAGTFKRARPSHDLVPGQAATQHRVDRADVPAYNPLGKLPGSVWEIATQPLNVPPALGVDHFAAFPMEWPRRLILGWSPREVCTACGEGRRPVTHSELEHINHTTNAKTQAGFQQHHGVRTQQSKVVGRNATTITGYACACGTYDLEGNPCVSSPLMTAPATSAPMMATSATSTSADSARIAPSTGLSATTQTAPPTSPGVVLDPFGGTGTTALVATMLGRRGISVDLSSDYNRLAQWRCSDPKERARAAGLDPDAVSKIHPELPGQDSLFDTEVAS